MIKIKLQLAITFILLSFMSFSQALVVFAEDPTPFYVILDGLKK